MRGARLGPRLACCTLLAVLAACKSNNPRVSLAERVAEAACACETFACADEAAKPILEGRGLLLEDYETLPDAQIARYHRAYARVTTCRDALAD